MRANGAEQHSNNGAVGTAANEGPETDAIVPAGDGGDDVFRVVMTARRSEKVEVQEQARPLCKRWQGGGLCGEHAVA